MDKRKMMAILFALVLLISSVPLCATAFESPPVSTGTTTKTVVIEGVSYQVNKNTEMAKVTSFDGSKEQVELPNRIECDSRLYPVTEIAGDAFQNCTSLRSVSVGASVTVIGSSAFAGCSALTDVTLPDSLATLSKKAFSGCTSLSTITIPKGVNCLKEATFENCTFLQSIFIFQPLLTVEKNVFFGCSGLQTVWYEADADARASIFLTANGNEPFSGAVWNYLCCSKNTTGLYHSFVQQTGTTCDFCGFEKPLGNGEDPNPDEDLEPKPLPGDVNEDQIVDSRDALYLFQYIAFGEESHPIPTDFDCDMNGDGNVTDKDVLYLAYHVAFGATLYPLN